MDAGTLLGGIILSGIGLVGFMVGRRRSLWKPMAIGAALMALPYCVRNVWVLWPTGLALTAALWFFRDE